ncbi:c-type cytochrome [Sphingomonas mollis]
MIRRIALGVMLLLAGCARDDREARRRAAGANAVLADYLRVADAGAGGRSFAACAACHTVRQQAPDAGGPNLYGVMGKTVTGASARFAYTAALQSVGGVWTPARMDRWLRSPAAFAPGTRMAFAGIADPLERADVIAFLSSQGPTR